MPVTPHIHGWRRGPAAGPAMPEHTGELPPAVDLTSACPPVNDQRSLGSCVANALCECLEYLQRQGASDVLYSRLYLYYWARMAMGVPPSEDSGLDIATAVRVTGERGVCLENSWDYSNPEQRFVLEPPPSCDTEAAQHKTILAFAAPTLPTIKASLAQGFPLLFGMEVFSSLISEQCADTGEVQMPADGEQRQGGHAVLCVGFSDADQRLIFRNSWGAWGKDGSGNGSLPYEFVTRGLASDFTTIRRVTP